MPKDTTDEAKDTGNGKSEYKMTVVGKNAMRGDTSAGQETNPNSTAEKKSKADVKEVDYSRPSGFRDGVRDQVWEKSKGKDGKVHDPLTEKTMRKGQPWDMGHKPGYEFHKLQADAAKTNLSRDEFLDIYNDPKYYRPELPASNRSHQNEAGPSVDKWRKTGIV